jgi:hypothetical protein
VGEDSASPVGPYESPFTFTGILERLELRSGPPPTLSQREQRAEREAAARMATLKD